MITVYTHTLSFTIIYALNQAKVALLLLSNEWKINFRSTDGFQVKLLFRKAKSWSIKL